MENQFMLYITVAAVIIAVICCITAIYALSSINKTKKALKENTINKTGNVEEIKVQEEKIKISENTKSEIQNENLETKETINAQEVRVYENSNVQGENIDPQVVAVITAAVMCMGGGHILSIKRANNVGWKRAARLAGMSNRVY